MLAKGIVAEEDVVPGHIGSHAVGPVKHPHLHKDQFLAVAQIQFIPGFHHFEVPIFMVLTLQGFYSVFGTVDRCIGNVLHQFRQCTAVIYFPVIGNDVIYFFQIDFLGQILHEFFGKGEPDRVNEDGLFLLDQIGIVGGAFVGGILIPMEFFQLPVYFTYPIYIILYLFFQLIVRSFLFSFIVGTLESGTINLLSFI